MKFNTRIIWLMPLILATSITAQKSLKPKQVRQVSSQNYGHSSSNNDRGSYPSQQQPQQYIAEQPAQPQYRAYSPGPEQKHVYPQIIQDQRQLNHDGTINYNYAADNGLQQGETVDPDGTRRGFYSYIGADGKPLTVKYTAGKNGFIAEGDHLPRQPVVPGHKDGDEEIYSKGGQNSGQYSPEYNSPQPQSQPQYRPQPRPQYSPQPQQYRPAGPSYSPKNNFGHQGNAVQYTAAAPSAFRGFQDFGPVNYGAPSNQPRQFAPQQGQYAAPQTQYPTHAVPSRSQGGSFNHLNPYQQDGPAGPYTGKFDLGNGGAFSIDFSPGPSQAVNAGSDLSVIPNQRF